MNIWSRFFFRVRVRGISIRGRLAIALRCFASACKNHGLDDGIETKQFLDHMWKFIGPDEIQFPDWERAAPALVHVGLGDPFPADLTAILRDQGIDEVEFRRLVSNLVEIVYDGAYTRTDKKATMNFLLATVELSQHWGGRCPKLRRFAESRWAENWGWGNVIPSGELVYWRHSQVSAR